MLPGVCNARPILRTTQQAFNATCNARPILRATQQAFNATNLGVDSETELTV